MNLSAVRPMSRILVAAAVMLIGLPANPQEKSVRPGINKDFENPDLKKFIGIFEGESRELYTQRQEIVAACQVKPGMAVADIGAGTGFFTRMFASAVGPDGKVYAVDIAPRFIEHIEKTAKEAGIKNVVGVVCKADSVELPADSIDLAFICDTYHHFEFPHRTMTSVHRALRPGGKVVLIDFHRIEGKSREWVLNHVRAGQEVFTKEIVANGFKLNEEKEFLKENYFLVFGKVGDAPKKPEPTTKLWEWERGIAVESREQKDMAVFLWFYEWNMFEAVKKGEHTQGTFQWPRKVNESQTEAVIGSEVMQVAINATAGGADLLLTITNKSDHDWPEIAGIIPCFNPGPNARNPEFANEKTYFLGPKGLELLKKREIHFNEKLRKSVEAVSRQGQFVFSDKWPTAEPDAKGGIIIRESTDGRWVTGIAWEDYLSVQGHNPWRCMHLCVRVGPLKQNDTKKVRGRIYLFMGTKEDCLKRYLSGFKVEAPKPE